VVSTALGVGLRILYYLVPLFGVLAVVGVICERNVKRLCVSAAMVTGVTALLTAAVVPVAQLLVPGLRQAIALRAGVIFVDMGTVSFIWPIVMAAGALVLMVGAIVVTAKFLKRRAEK